MKKKIFYISIVTLLVAMVLGLAAALGVARSGLVPIHADAAPSALEQNIFSNAVQASIKRRATSEWNSVTFAEEDVQAGEAIYKAMCAQCHGQLNGRPSTLGASFYPPAPQLPGRATKYDEAEVFWIVRHGIRNTAMPSLRRLLSDDDIRNVASFIKRLESQPNSEDVKRALPASAVEAGG
jgi:mono/diheme cytochrome c family protein